ncbi:putative duf323 domain-containing protein [Aspergillus affinis]|uniref:putative duf323 domain-containing protein n=1 Tax=Aspergillus affinis TaxID=1070780 RepID=UPI0022FECDFF|nr:putative duf323 domain-containing protein [Aspergillus affinis]KAI9042399.1 putative duf323 domain-containing protein [Aspergillus affinis]
MLNDPSLPSVALLHDIRQSAELLDLRSGVISGLASTPKRIPSLLLWDDQGLLNFEAWTKSPAYYPKNRELEILHNNRHEIARRLPDRFVLIELGCGNLIKTASILSALEKDRQEVHYYALDVSSDALRKSLGALKEQFKDAKNIHVSGLIGTYEDCADWLASSLPALTVTFLWIGNSIANLRQQDASILMGKFRQACLRISAECNFLISADGCAVEERLLKAYSPNEQPSRTFLFHGLHHANRLLGRNAFDKNDWDCICEYEKEQNELHFSYSPKRDLELDIGLFSVEFTKDEKVPYFMSGKWSESQVSAIAENAGFHVGDVWRDVQDEYRFYLLRGI